MRKSMCMVNLTVLLATVACSIPCHAQLNNDNAPWEMFAKRLISRLSVPDVNGKITNFQLVKQPTYADWLDPKSGDWNFLTFANRLAPPGEFYAPVDLTLYQQYSDFLGSLDLPPVDPKQAAATDKARKEWLRATEGYKEIDKRKVKVWAEFDAAQKALPASERTHYQVWLAREYGAKLGAQQQLVSEKAYKYSLLLADTYKGFSGIGALIANLPNTQYKKTVTSANDVVTTMPTFAYDANFASFVQKGDSGTGFEETWLFDKNHERRTLTWSSRSGSAGIKIGWFSAGGSASGSRESLDIFKDGVSMTVKFKNFTTIPITPGPWYNGDAIKALWTGPYKAGAIANKDSLFGPQGSFKPRVSQVVLVHRPSVTLKLDASQYSKVVETWSGSGSIGIGPFGFRGGARGGKDEMISDAASNTVTFEDKTGIPQIVAVYTISYPQ